MAVWNSTKNPRGMAEVEQVRVGFKFLRLNLGWVAIYVMTHVALILVLRFVTVNLPDVKPVPSWIPLVRLVLQLGIVTGVSLMQALIFMRFGREIDKPLWKCENDREAIKRFFMVWFILNLVFNLVNQVEVKAWSTEQMELGAFFSLLMNIGAIVYIPIGASIMHWGRLEWKEMGVSLRPLWRHIELLFPVLMLGYLGYILQGVGLGVMQGMGVDLKTTIAAPALVMVLPTLIELLAFTVMWQACMANRNNPPDDNDFDF